MNQVSKQKLSQIEMYGKQIEPMFSIPEEQVKYYLDLYDYFAKNECGLDLEKGLLISGGVGTGKTLSMRIMQRIFGKFKIVSARHVVREYLIEGFKVLDVYGRNSFVLNSHGNIDPKNPIHFCFDDILLEEVNAKFYGNQQNLMAEILLDRYDMFTGYKMLTYCTTNAMTSAIEETYGTRVKDRMREMMNVITLTGKSFRK